MANGNLPTHERRLALAQLSRDRLNELTSRFGLNVGDRRVTENHIEALVNASVEFRDVLDGLKREELKEICVALGLDTGGKEKTLLVERILASLGVDANGSTTLTLTVQEPKPKRSQSSSRRPASRSPSSSNEPTFDYRHDATRKNNPPAGLIDLDKPPPQPRKAYSYDPHLDPQLQWAGKAEHTSFDVDTVSLHIHERISTQAIIRAVKREDAQRDLFADADLPTSKAIEFYAHEVGWANRLVLGDSLLVMNSLLERENMAGQVQCIYMDPPYGVKFNSNFQPRISGKDSARDGDDDSLTREPEQIQAYRDTWQLGVHSYLTYMRDRLLLCRELLSKTGSIFVQISEENVHHVREIMDEVFGSDNLCSMITFRKKTMPLGSAYFEQVSDYILWYAKDRAHAKTRPLFKPKDVQGDLIWSWVELPDRTRRKMTRDEVKDHSLLPKGSRVYRLVSLLPAQYRKNQDFQFKFEGVTYPPPKGSCWKTDPKGMERLAKCRRLQPPGEEGDTLQYVMFLDDYPATRLTSLWDDTGGASGKIYVVQTSTTPVMRCILAASDPGDLVLDPTCGAGTTAYVAEQWGRRWITCDTSRVALALARQRLLTARYPFFRLRSERVKDGFIYKTAAHISMEDITNSAAVDTASSAEEAERLIKRSVGEETLFNQPEEDRSRVRVTGPLTVEAIPVASMEEPDAASETLESDARQDDSARPGREDAWVGDVGGEFVAYMIDLLKRNGGVHFKNGSTLPLTTIRALKTPHEYIHAESETGIEGDPRRVAVSFGPRHGPVTPKQVLEAIQQTRGYDIVLLVGFACDPEAGRMIETGAQGRDLHFVHAAPDILVTDLLKTSKATKLFTVFGLPDVKLHNAKEAGEITVKLSGIDIYDPTTGETQHDEGESVAAWFLDHDYDGRTFCVCQALFPAGKMKNPWEKIQKALKGSIDEEKFEALRGTESISFKPGKRIAVKVIDDRGNEVMKVVNVAPGLR